MRIILASASPRRIELLQALVDNFDVLPQNVDETLHYKKPHLAVKNLAKRKIEALIYENPKDTLIIGADTVVFFNDKYYNKPKDKADAKRMLSELRGNEHFVYTGVAMYYNGELVNFYVRSSVFMRDLTDEEIDKYIEEFNPLDKAGSYGIQDGDIVEKYEGSYSNIVGLPVERVKREMDKLLEEENGEN